MDLTAIKTLVADDFEQVNALIFADLSPDIPLINELSQHLIEGGGKRIRPLLVLLITRALNYTHTQHLTLAAIIEFLHTATLLHDDVVDASTLRRGRKTSNAIWGNEASVLVGDFLYSRAFQMMIKLEKLDILSILANSTNTIAGGEVSQLINKQDIALTESAYLKVIHDKTAALFTAATESGACLATDDADIIQRCSAYGKHLGIAYQLIDDALDYTAHTDEMGKACGDDFKEGKLTLPIIHALTHAQSDEVTFIRETFSATAVDAGRLEAVQAILDRCGSIEYTYEKAAQEIKAAISALCVLPDSEYKTALIALAEFTLARRQ